MFLKATLFKFLKRQDYLGLYKQDSQQRKRPENFANVQP